MTTFKLLSKFLPQSNLPIIAGLTLLFVGLVMVCDAQATRDTTPVQDQWWNLHFQSTVLAQYHPAFTAKYSGMNSLEKNAESTVSITSTLFLGARLWKGAQAYFNPELSGGTGFSQTRGIAGFTNGEVYRVSDPAPHIYIARLYLRQLISLSDDPVFKSDDLNQLAVKEPESYVSINVGKFSIMDFFDNNAYSHDPRTQFYNWALMGNGAWDYPANTRGYTYGLVMELVKKGWAVRLGFVMVPTTPNGSKMDFNIWRSNSSALELEKRYKIGKQSGILRIMGYLAQSRMGNYQDAMNWGKSHDTIPLLDSSRVLGHTKYGFGINIEHTISRNIALFLRGSWNDGHNETWVFTEIDRAISFGVSIKGELWKMKNDNIGVAFLVNGLSTYHRNFLKAGGYGFIIGDGALNYAPEFITEVYYSFRFFRKFLWLTPDFQFILNPAYNLDRGPVYAFGIRAHIEF
ncbi:MAG: carbohydrate porin [Bacteroidetes bacterium]|nr:carbohydrate porin [Bacteroidota bacterium]